MDRDHHGVVLTPAQLAHFATPKTWPEVFLLEPRMCRSRWRFGVIEADEDGGRALLRWTPAPRRKGDRQTPGGTWELTEAGRAFVATHLGTTTVH